MFIRLAWKELRETAWLALAALAVWLYLVMTMMGLDDGMPNMLPYAADDAFQGYMLVGMCLAAGLALRQTVGESARGTFPFLLHRPASRARLIGTKLLVGAGLYLTVAAVPLLLYCWWAATPGNHPSPFEWSMTAPAWRIWLAMTVLYLGAFLAGIRPGRWHGTRLLPLVASGGLAVAAAHVPWWWMTGLPAIVLLDALLVGSILYVARERDYS